MLSQIIPMFTAFALALPALAAPPRIGENAPDFDLKDARGKSHKLSDYKGKHVVLEWFNDECPYVEKHYNGKNMQKLQAKYTDQGVVWLTILSSAEGEQGFRTASTLKKIDSQWKPASKRVALFDPTGRVALLFGAKTTPHLFIVNPEQKVIYKGALDDQPSAHPKSLEDAKSFVATALDSSLKGEPVSQTETKPYGCSVKLKK